MDHYFIQSINKMQNTHYNKSFRLKTQKAIQIINIYENAHSDLAKLSLISSTYPIQSYLPRVHKGMEKGKWQKFQLLQDQSRFYQLKLGSLPSSKVGIKCVFKQYSGKEILFHISTREVPIPKEQCQFKISCEKIVKVGPQFGKSQKLFATFHSQGLTFFKFKYGFVQNEGSLSKSRVQSQPKLKINFFPSIGSQNLIEERKLLKSETSIVLKKNRRSPIIHRKQQIVTGRIKSMERQKTKALQAKQKKVDIQIYKQKVKQLRVLQRKCRGIIQDLQINNRQEKKKIREQMLVIVQTVAISKFMANFYKRYDVKYAFIKNNLLGLKQAKKVRATVKKAVNKFLQINQKLSQIIPLQNTRLYLTISHFIIGQTKCVYPHSLKKAGSILIDCLFRVAPIVCINQAMNQSTQYRIKVRTIQRYWKERNQAQLFCFQNYISWQSGDLCKKHRNFLKVIDLFQSENVGFKLSWQYLKQSSSKIRQILARYMIKLKQIQEIKQANLTIQASNKVALRKNQKALIPVPVIPAFPVTRYFRDISFLKKMMRTWLQIEHRKYLKKSKIGKVQSPTK